MATTLHGSSKVKTNSPTLSFIINEFVCASVFNKPYYIQVNVFCDGLVATFDGDFVHPLILEVVMNANDREWVGGRFDSQSMQGFPFSTSPLLTLTPDATPTVGVTDYI